MPQSTVDTRPLVLIIDDDLAVRESLAAVMEAFGFRTRTAGNGVEGLQSVGAEAPSTIITDLQMPKMTGFELITALRCTETDIPVIAISGSATSELEAARQMGAAAAFQKPLPVFDMIDAVCGLTRLAA
jgi:chemosensory pili system protein ChpA (sensor histidine kinase/response regulator)